MDRWTSIGIPEELYMKLKELKEKMGYRSFNQVIEYLIEVYENCQNLKENGK